MAIRAPRSGEEGRLVDAWRSGDIEALGMLYERYAPALRAYCAHRLGNTVDADDAVHDTFLKAQAGLVSFEPGSRAWPWLVTIARHVCADMTRRRRRLAELDGRYRVTTGDFDEVLAARVRAGIVGDALRNLPPRYRVPIYFKHFVGSTYDEIARVQGRSVASIRSMIMRGRRHLGTRIEEVARAERQWPLPAVVPDSWHRFRRMAVSLRETSWRFQQTLVAGLGSLGIVATSMTGGTHAAAATAVPLVVDTTLSSASAAVGSPASASHVGAPADRSGIYVPTFGAPGTVRRAAAESTPLPPIKPVYTHWSSGTTTVPGSDGRVAVEAGARVHERGEWIEVEVSWTVTTPLTGPKPGRANKEYNCAAEDRRAACESMRDVLATLPDEARGNAGS